MNILGNVSYLTDKREVLRWLFSFVYPSRYKLSGVLVISLLGTGLALVQPYLIKQLIDEGLLGKDMQTVFILCTVMIGTAITGILVDGITRWHYTKLSASMLFELRESVYSHLQHLSPAWHSKNTSGNILARLDGDIAEIQRFVIDTFLAIVNAVIAFIAIIWLMVSLSPILSMLIFIFLPLQVYFLSKMRPVLARRTKDVRERASDLTDFFFTNLPIIKFIQAMNAEHRQVEKLHKLNEKYLHDLLRVQLTGFTIGSVPNLMNVITTIMVFIIGGWMVVSNTLTLGTLIAFTAYMVRTNGPINTLLGLFVAIKKTEVSLVRVWELLIAQPVVESPQEPKTIPEDATGRITIECVSFRYNSSKTFILKDASLEIPGRTKIGITGISGAGKTTFIDLLHRHFDPECGKIFLDGINLRLFDLSILRQYIAVIGQKAVIVSGTVAENIAYSRPTATREEVEYAAHAAAIFDDIIRMPRGFDSMLLTRGDSLSEGQKQRLSLARIFLQDPLVLVLDESTSSVDCSTTTQIINKVDELFTNKTRIVVSHHTEPMTNCDQIYELKESKFEPYIHTLYNFDNQSTLMI